MKKDRAYILITAARNEEDYIQNTIECVLSQTIKPIKWVIVSDGSIDQTDDIIKKYSEKYNFITFIKKDDKNIGGGFISKVNAIRTGYNKLVGLEYSFIGILDADVTFNERYYQDILVKFEQNLKLGIGGGFIYEESNGKFRSRASNNKRSVAGAIQLFRNECYKIIGGHAPLKYGGEDWLCEIKARMRNWEVEAFPELIVFHHKRSTLRRGIGCEIFRQGQMDYCFGSNLFFEILKCIRRSKERPYIMHMLIRMAGFIWATFYEKEKPIADEIIKYLRMEQKERIKDLFVKRLIKS